MCGANSLQRGALAVGFFSTALLCLQEVLATHGLLVVQHPPISAYLTPCDLSIFPKLQDPLVREKNMLWKLANQSLYFNHLCLCV
jgi:hypothetical protein